MTWDQIPEAAALLASCADRPPETRYAKGAFGPNDGALIYDDERVKQLNAIHRREGERIWAECEASGNYEPYEIHCRLSVQEAVRKAVLSQPLRKVA